jgi:hypothetical protein
MITYPGWRAYAGHVRQSVGKNSSNLELSVSFLQISYGLAFLKANHPADPYLPETLSITALQRHLTARRQSTNFHFKIK